jgi:hypothetical protein
MLAVLAGWLPTREILVVADSAYISKQLLKERPSNVDALGPIHWKAALYEAWVEPQGRRQHGDRWPTPKEMLANDRRWPVTKQIISFKSGVERALEVKTITAGRRWRFLELSVFDSGPGLARRWLSGHPKGAADPANPTPEEEYRACVECFVRWNSSTRAGHKGAGLHEVMRTLSRLGAFFRVRTGRLSLYRDFVERPYTGAAGEDSSLADWTSRSASLHALAVVEGALYTMLIPIRGRPD